jgi:hypothetical protein
MNLDKILQEMTPLEKYLYNLLRKCQTFIIQNPDMDIHEILEHNISRAIEEKKLYELMQEGRK